jgi:phosphohistidine phosphatase SixA
VVAAPELRCQQTLEPLAAAARRRGHVDDRLGAGSSVQKALEVLPSFDEGSVVLCTHAELILGLLRFFELGESELRSGELPCRKGSIWVLQGFGRTPTSAIYRASRARRARCASRRRTSALRALDLGSTRSTC